MSMMMGLRKLHLMSCTWYTSIMSRMASQQLWQGEMTILAPVSRICWQLHVQALVTLRAELADAVEAAAATAAEVVFAVALHFAEVFRDLAHDVAGVLGEAMVTDVVARVLQGHGHLEALGGIDLDLALAQRIGQPFHIVQERDRAACRLRARPNRGLPRPWRGARARIPCLRPSWGADDQPRRRYASRCWRTLPSHRQTGTGTCFPNPRKERSTFPRPHGRGWRPAPRLPG